jgi:hypothetical protein
MIMVINMHYFRKQIKELDLWYVDHKKFQPAYIAFFFRF